MTETIEIQPPGPPQVPPTSSITLVTGAARGIGLAIATHLLNTGHRMALLDWDGPDLTRTATALAALDKALPLVAEAVARIQSTWGRLDTLVNNAGVAMFKPIGDTIFEEWQHVMPVNLNGPLICTQACVPLMLAVDGGFDAADVGLPTLRGQGRG